MKPVKYLDLIGQSLILGLFLIGAIAGLIERQLESIGGIAMYVAILLGPWQLISSLVTTIARAEFFKLRLIHLISSFTFLTIASLLAAFTDKSDFNEFFTSVGVVLGFGVPAGLAMMYYNITLKTVLRARAPRVAA